MFDIFTRPVVYIVGIFLTLVVVFNIYIAKMDTNVQTYCNDVIEEFVDEVRVSGYISAESYLEMTRKLNSTGNLYDISIIHQSRFCVPKTNPDGTEIVVDGEGKTEYTDSFYTYNKEDILQILFPEGNEYGRYDMKHGDFIKVSLSLKEPTMGAKLYSKWTGKALKTISGTYSGYIGNMGNEY